MDKIRIGLPRGLLYYYYEKFWIAFFEKLKVEVVVSPLTNKQIINKGLNIANDEMCMALKIFFGHVDYLKDKCDYLLVPRIVNYEFDKQACTNFLCLGDLIHNLFTIKTIDYNIELSKGDTLKKAFYNIGYKLGFKRKEIKRAYVYANSLFLKEIKRKNHLNYQKLLASDIKLLIVGYPYNIYDEYIGQPILKYLAKLNIKGIIACDFDPKLTSFQYKSLSKDLYWKYSQELLGAIELCSNKIEGIIFLSSFPCATDSLVNDVVMRKLKLPYLNLIVDDLDSIAGIETRLESFVDIIVKRKV